MNMKKMTALILGAVMSVSASSAAFAAIQSVDDLEGSVIGVQMGTTGDIYASKGRAFQQRRTGSHGSYAGQGGLCDHRR